MMADENELTMAICEYVKAQGATPIKGKTLDFQVDEHWRFAINGKKERWTPDNRDKEMDGAELGTADVCVWFNGWLAGIFNLVAGGTFVAGSEGNVEKFIAALSAKSEVTE
jgi:hypothetical protein